MATNALYRHWRVHPEGGKHLPAGQEVWAWNADRPTVEELVRHEEPSRHQLCGRYAWAIPNDEALDTIVAWGNVVEIGAGTGYWASLLAARGVAVAAYDLHPPDRDVNVFCDPGVTWTRIRRGGVAKAARHPQRTLLLCWPPYVSRSWDDRRPQADDVAYWAARRHLRAGGRRLVYVGEGNGGCTGGNAFHDLLEHEYALVRTVAIPQWWGLHDRAMFYERHP